MYSPNSWRAFRVNFDLESLRTDSALTTTTTPITKISATLFDEDEHWGSEDDDESEIHSSSSSCCERMLEPSGKECLQNAPFQEDYAEYFAKIFLWNGEELSEKDDSPNSNFPRIMLEVCFFLTFLRFSNPFLVGFWRHSEEPVCNLECWIFVKC